MEEGRSNVWSRPRVRRSNEVASTLHSAVTLEVLRSRNLFAACHSLIIQKLARTDVACACTVPWLPCSAPIRGFFEAVVRCAVFSQFSDHSCRSSCIQRYRTQPAHRPRCSRYKRQTAPLASHLLEAYIAQYLSLRTLVVVAALIVNEEISVVLPFQRAPMHLWHHNLPLPAYAFPQGCFPSDTLHALEIRPSSTSAHPRSSICRERQRRF